MLPLLASVVLAAPAEAAYRYWSYWHRDPGATGWAYANNDPSYYRVPDGAVEGWRFQPYGAANPSDPPPRSSARFAEICAPVPPADGLKRVAVVVDFGEGSVSHYCVQLATNGTGSDVLVQRAKELGKPAPRYNSSGLLCAIDGKPPAPECGRQVESPKPAATTAQPAPSSTRPAPATSTAAASAPVNPPADGGASTALPQPVMTRPGKAPSALSGSASPSAPPPSRGPSGSASVTPSENALVLETPTTDPGGEDGSGLPVATLVGIGLVGALGAAAALRMRSRA